MHIRYDGPMSWVIVEPFGPHKQGEVKDYPEACALDLLATSKKQKFTVIGEEGKKDPASQAAQAEAGQDPVEMTVARLKNDLSIFHSEAELKGLKKDALVALYISTRDALIALAG